MQTQAWLHETILVVHEHASLMCISQFRTNLSRNRSVCVDHTELPAERCRHDSRSLHIASAGLTFHKHQLQVRPFLACLSVVTFTDGSLACGLLFAGISKQ